MRASAPCTPSKLQQRLRLIHLPALPPVLLLFLQDAVVGNDTTIVASPVPSLYQSSPTALPPRAAESLDSTKPCGPSRYALTAPEPSYFLGDDDAAEAMVMPAGAPSSHGTQRPALLLQMLEAMDLLADAAGSTGTQVGTTPHEKGGSWPNAAGNCSRQKCWH